MRHLGNASLYIATSSSLFILRNQDQMHVGSTADHFTSRAFMACVTTPPQANNNIQACGAIPTAHALTANSFLLQRRMDKSVDARLLDAEVSSLSLDLIRLPTNKERRQER